MDLFLLLVGRYLGLIKMGLIVWHTNRQEETFITLFFFRNSPNTAKDWLRPISITFQLRFLESVLRELKGLITNIFPGHKYQ